VNNRRGGTIVLARELALYQTIGYNPAPFKAVTGDLGARRLSSARRKVRAARPRNHRRIRPAARCARQCGKKSVRAGSRAMDRPALQGGVGAANARLRDYRYWCETKLYELMKNDRVVSKRVDGVRLISLSWLAAKKSSTSRRRHKHG